MKELKIRIVIDEKTNRILVAEEVTGIPPGIEKELILSGVYNYLLLRHSKKFHINEMGRVER